jgi:hypothetical protein
MRLLSFAAFVVLSSIGCNSAPAGDATTAKPAPPSASASEKAAKAEPRPAEVKAERFGAPVDTAATKVALTEVAKEPSAFVGKTFATQGIVTAVCQHRGCWMELKDDAGEAHIKMAGHAFFVPRSAAGKKAVVLATLAAAPEAPGACGDAHGGHEPGKGCKAEAEAQLGRPLAKLELIATGVEIL